MLDLIFCNRPDCPGQKGFCEKCQSHPVPDGKTIPNGARKERQRVTR